MQCFLVPLGIKVQRHQSCLGKRKGIDWWKGEKKSQRKKSKIDSHKTVTAEYSSLDNSIKFSLKKKSSSPWYYLLLQPVTKPCCCLLFWAKQQVGIKASTRAILMSRSTTHHFGCTDNTQLLKILLIRMVLLMFTVCQMSRDLKAALTQAHTSKAWRKKVLFSDLAHSMHSKHNSTCNRERQYMQHYVLTFFPQALLGRTASFLPNALLSMFTVSGACLDHSISIYIA